MPKHLLALVLLLSASAVPAAAATVSINVAGKPAAEVEAAARQAAARACRAAHSPSGPIDAHRACVRNSAAKAMGALGTKAEIATMATARN